MSGFISPKRAVKSRMDSRIFSDFNCGILSLVEEVFCSALIAPGVHINFAAKRKMASTICSGVVISFLPLFRLYFNERIYEYGDKVKVEQNSMQKLKFLELNSGKVFKTITKPQYTTRK